MTRIARRTRAGGRSEIVASGLSGSEGYYLRPTCSATGYAHGRAELDRRMELAVSYFRQTLTFRSTNGVFRRLPLVRPSL